jgi:thioredoxin
MNKLRFIILSGLLFIGFYLQAQKAEKQSPHIKLIVSDSAFVKEIYNHKIVVVDFWAVWCKPCQFFLPEYESVAKAYHKKAVFYKLDFDLCKATAEQYQVVSIPVIIIFKNGEEMKRYTGLTSKERIIIDLEEIIKAG